MKEVDKNPICYRDVESILRVIGSHSKADLVINFLRRNKLFEEWQADYASSLIILVRSQQWRIRADLNASPELQHLPIIRRTGTSSPWMRGFLLGFEDDVVTDTDLQRAHCLFFSKQAAIEEWIDLLIRIFKMLTPWTSLSSDEIRELGKMIASEDSWFVNNVCNLMQWYQNTLYATNQGDDDPIQEEIYKFLKFRLPGRELPRQAIEQNLKRRLRELREWRESSDWDLPDHALLRNLMIGLLLALGDNQYNLRHLGSKRLRRIAERSHHPHNLVIQGAGDLSMNEWNLAFYYDLNNKAQVFIPENETFGSRTYNCLVVWSDKAPSSEIKQAIDYIQDKALGVSLGQDISITRLRFSKGRPYIQFPDKHPLNHRLHDLANFAVYGKILLRDGKVVEPVEIVDEFQDLRHVFALPNLNPADLNPAEDGGIIKRTAEIIDKCRCDWAEKFGPSSDILYRFIGDYERFSGKFRESRLDSQATPQFANTKTESAAIFDKGSPTYLIEVAEKIWQRGLAHERQEIFYQACQDLKRELDHTSQFLVSHFSELRHFLNRPRPIFGQFQKTDVWLLEHALIKDRSLRHLACTSAIAVDLAELGAPQVWINLCLLRNGYRKQDRLFEVREPGDFAWDESDSHPRLFIRLKMNTYPCTIVAIGNLPSDQQQNEGSVENNAFYLLAWGHDFSRGNHTIWDCARVLQAAGARYALVMDEGNDVFQCFIENDIAITSVGFNKQEEECGSLDAWMPVPIGFALDDNFRIRNLNRRGLRVSLAFWQEERG